MDNLPEVLLRLRKHAANQSYLHGVEQKNNAKQLQVTAWRRALSLTKVDDMTLGCCNSPGDLGSLSRLEQLFSAMQLLLVHVTAGASDDTRSVTEDAMKRMGEVVALAVQTFPGMESMGLMTRFLSQGPMAHKVWKAAFS